MAFPEEQDFRIVGLFDVAAIPVNVVLDILVAALVISFGICESLKFFDLFCCKTLGDDPEVVEDGTVDGISKVTKINILLVLSLRDLGSDWSVNSRLKEENEPVGQDTIGKLGIGLEESDSPQGGGSLGVVI